MSETLDQANRDSKPKTTRGPCRLIHLLSMENPSITIQEVLDEVARMDPRLVELAQHRLVVAKQAEIIQDLERTSGKLMTEAEADEMDEIGNPL